MYVQITGKVGGVILMCISLSKICMLVKFSILPRENFYLIHSEKISSEPISTSRNLLSTQASAFGYHGILEWHPRESRSHLVLYNRI